MDYRVHGILQARILDWVAFPFFRGSCQPRDQTQVSCTAGGFFYQLSHKGSPRTLEWVAYPFSSGSFQPRNQTWVPCIAGGFFTNRAIREASVLGNVLSFQLQCTLSNQYLPYDQESKYHERTSDCLMVN